MDRGQKKLKKQHVVVYPVFWPKQVLENIGRFTYRSIFWLIAIFFKTLIQLIKVCRKIRLPRLSLAIISISILFILLSLFYWFILKGLPSPADLTNHRPAAGTQRFSGTRKSGIARTFGFIRPGAKKLLPRLSPPPKRQGRTPGTGV